MGKDRYDESFRLTTKPLTEANPRRRNGGFAASVNVTFAPIKSDGAQGNTITNLALTCGAIDVVIADGWASFYSRDSAMRFVAKLQQIGLGSSIEDIQGPAYPNDLRKTANGYRKFGASGRPIGESKLKEGAVYRHMYALYHDDYLAGATDNSRGMRQDFWPHEMRQGNDFAIIKLSNVPVAIGDQLMAMGTSEQTYRDGYEAAKAAKPYAVEDVDLSMDEAKLDEEQLHLPMRTPVESVGDLRRVLKNTFPPNKWVNCGDLNYVDYGGIQVRFDGDDSFDLYDLSTPDDGGEAYRISDSAVTLGDILVSVDNPGYSFHHEDELDLRNVKPSREALNVASSMSAAELWKQGKYAEFVINVVQGWMLEFGGDEFEVIHVEPGDDDSDERAQAEVREILAKRGIHESTVKEGVLVQTSYIGPEDDAKFGVTAKAQALGAVKADAGEGDFTFATYPAAQAFVKWASRFVGAHVEDLVVESKRKRPVREGFDTDESLMRELELYIENDGNLYRQQLKPIIQNLKKKIAKGKYDPNLAPKLWQYLVDEGARRYAKEFGGPGSNASMFPKQIRIKLAQKMAADYYEQIMAGEFGPLDEAVVTWPKRKLAEGRVSDYLYSESSYHNPVSPEQIAQGTGMSREQVMDELYQLERDGRVSMARTAGGRSGYFYPKPKWAESKVLGAGRFVEDVFDRRKIQIAKQTLLMHNAAAAVMGGPSKDEARATLKAAGWSEAKIAQFEGSGMARSDVKESTDSALSVANIIMGGQSRIDTAYGMKNLQGLANLIDRNPAATAADAILSGEEFIQTASGRKSREGLIDMIQRAKMSDTTGPIGGMREGMAFTDGGTYVTITFPTTGGNPRWDTIMGVAQQCNGKEVDEVGSWEPATRFDKWTRVVYFVKYYKAQEFVGWLERQKNGTARDPHIEVS